MKRNQFKAKMESLTIDQIKEFILLTWNDATGGLFREIGFEVIEERLGEEEGDRIYSELWHTAHAA